MKKPSHTKKRAEGILEKDFAALEKKLASQKPLTSAERTYIAKIAAAGEAENPKITPTQTALAAALGISVQALNIHVKKPEAPKSLADVQGWRDYLLGVGKMPLIAQLEKAAGGSGSGKPESKLTMERARQLYLQNDRLRTRNARERGALLPKVFVEATLSQLVTAFRQRLLGSAVQIATLARTAASTSEAAADVRREHEEILRSMSTSCNWFRQTELEAVAESEIYGEASATEKSEPTKSEPQSHA